MEACGHTPIWSGVRVERTNARGRHTYVPAFKRWIVEQARVPGMSVAALAMSNQVNANQLRRWIQQDGLEGAGNGGRPVLLPVTIATSQSGGANMPVVADVALEIELAGAVVRVRAGVPAETLRMVVSCLRTTP